MEHSTAFVVGAILGAASATLGALLAIHVWNKRHPKQKIMED